MRPTVDERALVRALDRPGVVAGIVFGSRSRSHAREGADLDVGVWLDPGLEPDARLRLRLTLDRELAGLPGPVDVTVLNDAPLLVRHRVLRDGVVVIDRDPLTRIRLETDGLIRFLDTVELRATLAAGTRARLAEGRFGRP